MSFGDPVLLVGLVLLPLAALAYVAMQRRRRREAAAWANPALVPGLVTARPGWRRHLPAALLGLALAGLLIAVARPQHTVAAAEREGTVMMVTDVSGSMRAMDVRPDRLSAAKRAAETLTDKLPASYRLGLVTFSDYAEQRAAPSTDRSPVRAALDHLEADGGTAMGDGLERGLQAALQPVPGPDGTGTRRLPAVMVLLSDGKNNAGGADPVGVARRARRLHIPIYTIALGTAGGEVQLRDTFGFLQRVQVPPDIEGLKEIARVSGGRAFATADADKLSSIYANLGTRLSSRPVQKELTAGFVGASLVLLLAGGALSLRWFGRLL
jgi:Ca-activated chloride channel homolog